MTETDFHKKKRKSFCWNAKKAYLCACDRRRQRARRVGRRCGRQGYSPDGLERCSHIAEVIGSSPIIPTSPKSPGKRDSRFPGLFPSYQTLPFLPGTFSALTRPLRFPGLPACLLPPAPPSRQPHCHWRLNSCGLSRKPHVIGGLSERHCGMPAKGDLPCGAGGS